MLFLIIFHYCKYKQQSDRDTERDANPEIIGAIGHKIRCGIVCQNKRYEEVDNANKQRLAPVLFNGIEKVARAKGMLFARDTAGDVCQSDFTEEIG